MVTKLLLIRTFFLFLLVTSLTGCVFFPPLNTTGAGYQPPSPGRQVGKAYDIYLKTQDADIRYDLMLINYVDFDFPSHSFKTFELRKRHRVDEGQEGYNYYDPYVTDEDVTVEGEWSFDKSLCQLNLVNSKKSLVDQMQSTSIKLQGSIKDINSSTFFSVYYRSVVIGFKVVKSNQPELLGLEFDSKMTCYQNDDLIPDAMLVPYLDKLKSTDPAKYQHVLDLTYRRDDR